MHLQYGCAFVEVEFYPPMCDHEAQKLASTDPKCTFFQVEVQVIFIELSKDLF